MTAPMGRAWPCAASPDWSSLHLDPLPDGRARISTSYGGSEPRYMPVVLDREHLGTLVRHAVVVGQALTNVRALPDRRGVFDIYTPTELADAARPGRIRIDAGNDWVETSVRELKGWGWVCAVTTAGPRTGIYKVLMRPEQWAEIADALAEAYDVAAA